MPKLTAKTALPYGLKQIQAGEVFEASDRDARTLVFIGKASMAADEVEPVESEKTEAKSRGTYKTRDLKAK